MDFRNETNRTRLARAVKSSYRSLEKYRGLSRALVAEYAGPGYLGAEVRRDQYLNLMLQAVEAYTMALTANCPQVLISTHNPSLKPFARHFQTALNNLMIEIGINKTLSKWLMDAFFCIGITKVHLADSALVEIEQDVWMDPGIPYLSNVSLDDFVYDVSAKTTGQCKFFGDMYRIPYADLQSGQYDSAAIRDIRPTSKEHVSDDRLDQISRGYETDVDEFEPMVDLCDIYIPRDQMIYTFSVKDRRQFDLWGDPLAEMEWTGSEHGCYHLLGFNDVPENIMPASPADQLASLSRLVNNLMRKQSQQARRQKTMHTYTAAGTDSAKRMQRGNDGDWIQVSDPTEIGTVVQGGVDASNQAFMLNTIEMFDRAAGNLQALLGLGPQASTVGQEQLVHTAATKKITSMQVRYVECVKAVVKDLGQLLWEDGFKTIPAQMEIPGTDGISVDATWTPSDREGSFVDYNFEVDVFSLPYQTPGQRLQAITQSVSQIFIPLAPMLMEQGGTIDLAELSAIMAEMMNEPRIKDVIKFTRPTTPGEGVSGPMTTKSPTSSREYVRRNVGSGSNSVSMAKDWATMANSNGSAK